MPHKFLGASTEICGVKTSHFDQFFATSTFDTAYLRNETSQRQTKMLMSIYNVSPKRWPTFRDFYPFRHCDSPFGGHYVATIIVATCLVNAVFFWFCYYRKSLGTQDPMDLMCWCVFHSHREIYWLYRNWKLRFSLGKLHLETEDIRIFTVGAVLESQYVYIRLIVSVLIHSISYTTFIHWKHFTERTLYF